jgi:alpha-D-ribose 1-methylphosphonate 5-triphosphate synthase subunit PhnG
MSETDNAVSASTARKRRMEVLARCDRGKLEELWSSLGFDPAFETLRGPQTGLVTVRGRIGGGGAPFNIGEATATRASVRLSDGRIGHSAMLGRDRRKARLAAVIDALAQGATEAETIERQIIGPLERLERQREEKVRAQTAATRVEFFTMVRGED